MSNTIIYIFRLESGTEHRFDVDLNRPVASGALPDWTLLDTNKCENCPLASGPGARCPAAADLVPIVAQFSALASIGSVDVRVVRPQFEATKHTDTQTALSALMGLILATSACPILSRMRPLAHMHLPFPTENEVVFRLASAHLLGCYLGGITPDLTQLMALFEELGKLNEAFAKRLKRAIQNDASINALVELHTRSMMASFSFDDQLNEIRVWFGLTPVNPSQ